jgi:protein-tyrosine phosphatase
MDFVAENIAIGGKKDGTDTLRMESLGVGGQLNVAIDLDVNHIPESNSKILTFPIEYHKIGLKDNELNALEVLEASVYVLEQLLSKHDKVLVNCRAGASRSVVVICLYFVKNKICSTFDDAVKLIESKRKGVNINPGLRMSADLVLKKWEEWI